MENSAEQPPSTAPPSSDAGPYKQLALNVGANFAQSIASETFKQTIVANAAGLAAIVAYLSNSKNAIAQPLPLAVAAACFLSGVGVSLLGLMLTYTHSSRLLSKMLSTAVKGVPYRPTRFDRFTGAAGEGFGWLGVTLFLIGAACSGYGLYLQFASGLLESAPG